MYSCDTRMYKHILNPWEGFYASYTSMQLSSCLSVSQVHVLLRAMPLIDLAPWNDATSLTMYTTHTHTCVHDTNMCIFVMYIKLLGKQL